MRNTVINRITHHAKRHKEIFLIAGDAGFGVLDDFKKSFPSRFLNLGVAEQNMISFAAGLANAGHKPFVYNIIPFLLYRCYEQVRNDICYQRLPVTLVGIGSGVTYAPQGVTHYSVEDIAIARTLPNLVILSPSDPIEAAASADYAVKSQRPVYIRLAKTGEAAIHKKAAQDINKPLIIKEGRDVAVLFHGSIASEVIKATEDFKDEVAVISIPMLQPLDAAFLERALKDVRAIITVEEHFVRGGLGSIMTDWVLDKRPSVKLKTLGISNEFIHAIKDNAGMRSRYGISANGIRKAIEEALADG